MKQIICFITALFLISALHAQSIRIRVPDTTIVVGNELVLPVYADSSLTGRNVVSYMVELSYNGNILKPLELIKAGTLSASFYMESQEVPTNKFRVSGASATPLTGKGVLFYVRFATLTNGGQNLGFTTTEFNYLNEGSIPLIFDAGNVNVLAKPNINVTANTYFVKMGDPVQGFASGGKAPYTWTVTDNSVATVSSTGLATTIKHGHFKFKASDADGYFDSSAVVRVAPFYVWLRDTTEWQGTSVKIPVYYRNLSSLNVMSGEIAFTYSGNVLSNPTVDVTGSLLSGIGSAQINAADGTVQVAFANSVPMASNGVLFYVRFDISSTSTGSSNLNFTGGTFNENSDVFTKNGRFTTKNWPVINVNGAAFMMAGQTYNFTANPGIAPYTWSTNDANLATAAGNGSISALRGGFVDVLVKDDVGASGSKKAIPVYDLLADVSDTTAAEEDTFNLPIMVTAIPNERSYSSFDAEVTFNSTYLEFLDVVTTGTLSSSFTVFKSLDGNELKIAAAGSSQLKQKGKLIYLRFVLKPGFNANSQAYVNLNKLTFNEGTPTVRTQNGYIRAVKELAVKQWFVDEKAFNLWPNPSKGEFVIQSRGFVPTIERVEVYDLTGALMNSYNGFNLNTMKISIGKAGIYLLRINTPEGVLVKRIVIE
jgi:hypothetical protein